MMNRLQRNSFSWIAACLIGCAAILLQACGGTNVIRLTDPGPDNTATIQQAIDRCAAKGGGTVELAAGVWHTGPLELKSGVGLCIDEGAVLSGSDVLDDYKDAFPIVDDNMYHSPALIRACEASNIFIKGSGTIDGNGGSGNFQFGNDSDGGPRRPKLLYFVNCENVEVEGVTLRNPAYWTQHYERCSNVHVHDIKVFAHGNWNNDGIDLDCDGAVVHDCFFDTDDDAICLKSDHEEPSRNIHIYNCDAASNCCGIKLGTSSFGGFQNVDIHDCNLHQASEDNRRHWYEGMRYMPRAATMISGIAVQSVDGGIVDGVKISNITMSDVQTPIFIRLGDRRRAFRKEGSVLRNVLIENIDAKAVSLVSSSIMGVEGLYVEGVTIRNATISYPGGGEEWMISREVPEMRSDYPESRRFGDTMPASGFYVRHAKDISFENVRFIPAVKDPRPEYMWIDAEPKE